MTQAWRLTLPEFPISICKPFSNHKPLGSRADFLFVPDPEYNLTCSQKSKWGGAFTPVLLVFYQLISNTWSHANPLTPLAVSAHTNRNKHIETHYINYLSSPALIILQCLPSPLFFPAPVVPCFFCYLSTSSFRSAFHLHHSQTLSPSLLFFPCLLLPIFWQPHFFISFSPSLPPSPLQLSVSVLSWGLETK